MKLIEDFSALDTLYILNQGELEYSKINYYVDYLLSLHKYKEARELENISEEDFVYLINEYLLEKRQNLLN